MTILSSFFIYNIVFGLSLFLFKKKLDYVALLLLIVFSVLRFDVGADYSGYYDIISESSSSNFMEILQNANMSRHIELGFCLLIYLFSSLDYCFLYVLGVCSILTIYMWYVNLKERDSVFWGFFIILYMMLLVSSYDQVRQYVAISIILYSYKYLEQSNIKYFVIFVLFASLFHLSVLLILSVYPIRKINLPIKIRIYILLIIYIASYNNVWDSIFAIIISNVSYYSNFIDNTMYISSYSFNSGFNLYFKIFFYLYVMIKIKDNTLLSNFLFIGLALLIFASGNPIITRFSNYFLYAIVMAFPYYIKKIQMKDLRSKLLVFVIFIYFQLISFYTENYYVPYKTILYENIEHPVFRVRNYEFN